MRPPDVPLLRLQQLRWHIAALVRDNLRQLDVQPSRRAVRRIVDAELRRLAAQPKAGA